MLAEFSIAALLISAGDIAESNVHRAEPVRLAMAAALLSAAGEKRYEPPEPLERPAPPNAPAAKSGALPAPMGTRLRGMPERDSPPILADRPRAETLPAPLLSEKFAQASPNTNDEILRRLERLEQENRQLRDQLKGSPPQAPAPATIPNSPTPTTQTAPAQMIPGWRLSLYDWNADGFISGEPTRVFNVRNDRFTGALGQASVRRTDRYVPYASRMAGHSNQMFIYKLEGWLHVTKPGQYQLGFETTCAHGHPCNLLVRLGDQQVLNERHQHFENRILFQGRDLPVGDYRIEVIFNIATNKFLKFDPRRMMIYPLVRGPGEYNFRNFGPQELLTEANPSIPSGPPG